jgi:hypothetical protein
MMALKGFTDMTKPSSIYLKILQVQIILEECGEEAKLIFLQITGMG